MVQKERIWARVPEKYAKAIEKISEDEGTSKSSLLERIITSKMREDFKDELDNINKEEQV